MSLENKETLLTTADSEPVTVSISRKVKPGCEAEYEAWISDVIDVARDFPGHQGASVLRPCAATNQQYVIIYRFASYEDCRRWEDSDLRTQWLEKIEPWVDGEAVTRRGTGLEFWFDLPELPAQRPPSPHKMALVLVIVVFTLVMAINLIFGSWLAELPIWLRTFLVVLTQVLLMTYIVMPRVTNLLKSWLFK